MDLGDLYSQDIAPLKNQYGLSKEEATHVGQMYDRDVVPQLNVMMKLQDSLSRQRTSQLNFERTSHLFDQEKKKAQREAEYIGKANEVTQVFDTILNQSADPFDATKAMNSWAMNNSRQLAEDNTTKAMYNAALSRINTMRLADDDKLKKEALLDKDTGYAVQLANLGGYDEVERLVNEDGTVTQKEEYALGIAQQQQERQARSYGASIAEAGQKEQALARSIAKEEFTINQKQLQNDITRIQDAIDSADTKVEEGPDGEMISKVDIDSVMPLLKEIVPKDKRGKPLDYLSELQKKKQTDMESYLKYLSGSSPTKKATPQGSSIRK
jgi:hypothetical protein